jgi:hypothetical protein
VKKKTKLPKVFTIPHLDGFIILDGELKAIERQNEQGNKIHVTYRNLTEEEKRKHGIIRLGSFKYL